jgi:aldehyde:ferredoxin oxidoreductase
LSGQIPKEQIEGKAKLHIDYEDRAAIFDSLILCRFFRDFYQWEDLLDLVSGSTGMKLTKPQLEDLANNITNLTRQYNHREGLGRSTDTLPKPLFQANREGAKLTEAELATMIHEYDQIRERHL